MKEMMTTYLNQDRLDYAFTICILIAGFWLFSIWSRKKGQESLEAWAEKKNLKIITSRKRLFLPNFQWASGKYQQFYRVTVSDHEGKTREGWVRCSKLWVTEPDKVEVVWDDEDKRHPTAA